MTNLSIPQQVRNSIKDNFAHFTESMIDAVLVGGLTLRQRLNQDKVKQRADKNFHMGKLYYNSVRHQYEEAADSEVAKALVVLDKDEVVDPRLKKATEAAKANVPNRSFLLEFFQTAKLCNQKGIVGIIRFLRRIKQNSNPDNVMLCVEGLKYLTRTNAWTHFPSECEAVKMTGDACFANLLEMLKDNDTGLEDFWLEYKHILHHFINVDVVERLMQVTDTWVGHEEDLSHITNSGLLGK